MFGEAKKWPLQEIGESRESAPESYAKASPLKYVSSGDPPIRTIHGTKDELVPFDQWLELMAACKKRARVWRRSCSRFKRAVTDPGPSRKNGPGRL